MVVPMSRALRAHPQSLAVPPGTLTATKLKSAFEVRSVTDCVMLARP